MWRKYIPRAFPRPKGFESLCFNPAVILDLFPFAGVFKSPVLEALGRIKAIVNFKKKFKKTVDK
jgi:hypothetical protein